MAWDDRNDDGRRDVNEPPMVGITVTLLDRNGTVISTTVTDASGHYTFTNLAPGQYGVQFTPPPNYIVTIRLNDSGRDEDDSDAEENSGRIVRVVLAGGTNDLTNDIGLQKEPDMSIEKSVLTPTGGGNGTSIEPGDRLTYTLVVKNIGRLDAANVTVTDPLRSNIMTYVPNSANPPVTMQTENTLVWKLGTMRPGQEVRITFVVQLAQRIQNSTVITNVAQVTGNEGAVEVVSRDSNPVNNPLDPSAVTLSKFEATHGAKGVRVKWVTLAEVDTWSFSIYRANGVHTGEDLPSDAVKVTPADILAEGRGTSGATYEFVDETAVSGKTYTYWLSETETTGRVNVYGPAKWAGPSKIFLPMLTKLKRVGGLAASANVN